MIRKLTLISWLFLMVGLLPVMAQSDAQDSIPVVDMSQFSTTGRVTTLMIPNGRNERLVNGRLTRKTQQSPALNDDLQNFINNVPSGAQTRASDGFTVVDLSKFSATVRKETLMITNGQKIRFVNGTLTRVSQLSAPVMKISGGSEVEVSSSNSNTSTRAIICNDNITNHSEIINIADGTLRVKDYGFVDGGYDETVNRFGFTINMSNNDAKFYLENNGWLRHSVYCASTKALIQINGGRMMNTSSNYDYGYICTSSDVTTVGDIDTQIDLYGTSNIVKLISAVQVSSRIYVEEPKSGRKVVESSNGYILTENDRSKLKIRDRESNKDLNTYLKDNAIYIGDSDDLQTFINNTPTNTNDYTVVDLSKFSAKNRTKTLEITGGRKIRFVNGIITRMDQLLGPVIKISDGSEVEIASSNSNSSTRARISGKIINGHEIILLENGALRVKDYGWIDGERISYTEYDNAVFMTNDNDRFILEDNGWVSGPVVCNSNKSYICISGGSMFTGSADFGTINTYSDVNTSGNIWLHINLLGKENKVFLCSPLEREMQIAAPLKTYNDIIVKGYGIYVAPQYTKNSMSQSSHAASNNNFSHVMSESDFNMIKFVNDKNMGLYFESKYPGCARIGIDDLQDFLNNLNNGDGGEENGSGTEEDPYEGYVPCSGLDVDKDVNFNGDDLQYYLLYGKMPSEEESSDDCDGTVRQNDGDVHIDKGSTVTLRNIYWHGCGCKHYIYVSGTLIIDVDIYIYNYLRFIHLLPGGRVIIRGIDGEVVDEVIYVEGGTVEYRGGDTSGGKYGWYNVGGTIYIYDGTIKGGICGGYTSNKGITYIYGGTVTGGVMNYGTTYIYGGTISGGAGYTIYNYKGGNMYIYGGTCSGNGTIWNEGNLYLDGGGSVNVNISDIYMIKGCHIYILNRLTYILRLHITMENIILDTPIIIGGNGYKLTQADCDNLQIELPDGYGWRYDSTSGGIIIYSTTGIENVDAGTTKVVGTYDASGRRIGEPRKGINVEKMSNGTVRKVIVK